MPRTFRDGAAWRAALAVAAAALLVVFAVAPVEGLIVHAITLDGNVADWADVLTDPENVVADAGSFSDPPDPDFPGTADRDLRGAAFTWDSTFLYLFLRRTLSGASSFEFLAYVDRDHDGFMETTDRVVRYSYNGAAFALGRIYAYAPVAPGGDVMTGDGTDMPGNVGAQVAGTPTSANSPDGIEFEAGVRWSDLGVPAGSCVIVHVSIARGVNLPGQVEDNADLLDTQDVEPRLEEDRVGSSGVPGTVDHAHRACNDGNCGDRLDLTVRSALGWPTELFTDPDGDGDPSDGVLLAYDGNGDGDYSDDRDGDVIEPGADSDGNRYPDTGLLGGDACFDYVVRVHVPAGTPAGTTDVEIVRARSASRASALVRNRDETTVGPVTVVSDEDVSAFAGGEAWIAHVACNHQAFADALDLSVLSTRGWTVEIWSDPDGDGDASDGAITGATPPLAPGACFTFLTRSLVPAGETAGAVDVQSITARSQASSSVSDSAADEVLVAGMRFSVTPDHARDAGPGNTLFLPHVLTNHQGAADSFQLTATSALAGWTLTLLSDPDGDGEPDDASVIANGSVVGPVARNGGTFRFIVRADVPQAAPIGAVDTITVLARSQADTTRTAQALDVVTIRRTLTYSDPLFARPSKTFFTSCAKVYVQSHGLQTNRDYRFQWLDPLAGLRRTSPTYKPDARGRADDAFSLPCGIGPGSWTIRLQERSGAAWNDVAGGAATFTTLDPLVASGDVDRLETDQPIYDVDSDDVSVEATLDNDTDADYVDTFVEYVVFRDGDGSGAPTPGESYILPTGAQGTWAAGDLTHESTDITVFSGDAHEDFWQVDDAQFQSEGAWCVHARWAQRCPNGSCSEVTIDEAVTCFLVTCLPLPEVDAGADRAACEGEDVPLAGATAGGDTVAWSDDGAGGAFVPSADVLDATWIPPGIGAWTLRLTTTEQDTGCVSFDEIAVVVSPKPAAFAGPDVASCAGEPVALAGADGGIADVFAWSDGGAGGSFLPSADVENPEYVHAAPGAHAVTLVATVSATGCASSDTAIVVVAPNPVVDAGPDLVTCAGEAASLGGASAAPPGVAVAWSDGGAGGAFVPSATTLGASYVPPDPSPAAIVLTLVATDPSTGCDSVDTTTVSVDANPEPSAGPDASTCADAPHALAGAAAGGADAFAWSDGGAGGTFVPSADVLAPTWVPPAAPPATVTLTLVATVTATGCASSDDLVLTIHAVPEVQAGPDAETCAGDGIDLGAGASGGGADAFAWSDGGAGGTFLPSASALDATYVPPDPSPASVTLTLTGTVSATGCAASDELVLAVHANPTLDLPAEASGCRPFAVEFEGPASPADISWTDGGAGGALIWLTASPTFRAEYANAVPGTHVVTVTATDAATGCATSDSVAVTVLPQPAVDAGPPLVGCVGASVPLSGATSDADVFAWSDGAAPGTFSPSADVLNPVYTPGSAAPVTLSLTATSSATGCSWSDSTTLTVSPAPVAAFEPEPGPHCEDAAVCFVESSSGATSWSWSFGDAAGSTSTVREPCFAYAQPGSYDVTLAASGPCGTSVTTRTVVVSPVPVADFSFSTQGNHFCRDRDVSFTDLSTNAPTSWTWSFGDGGTSSAQHPVHAYAGDGVFVVRLVACNACGCGTAYRAVEIAASCNTNCEANSNQVSCEGAGAAEVTGDTCTDADNFDTTSYPCAPGLSYGGPNKTYDLNFVDGSNFVVRLIETVPEPNGYDLDLFVSDRCNPPRCVAWGDAEVAYDDRTPGNDDFFLIVDGRDGSCGPYRLEVECIDETESSSCAPPVFAGVADAEDVDPCAISGIAVTWAAASGWGAGPDGAACAGGTYEIWRAPLADLSDERRVGAATPPATTFTDAAAVPGVAYRYRVHAINACCGEVALTAASAEATDLFSAGPVTAGAGPDRVLTCDQPSATLVGTASGGTGSGFAWSWTPVAGLSDPAVPNPVVTEPGTYTVVVRDLLNGCEGSDSVVVAANDAAPVVGAGPDRLVTCLAPVVELAGTATGDGSLGFAWSWSPAGPLDDPASPTPRTGTPGTYVATVEDVATGCVGQDEVVVMLGTAAPVADAGPDRVITCATPSVTLQGTASGGDGGGGHDFAWTPAAGLDDATSPSPIASVPGTWTLTVTDRVTGCTGTDTVTVGAGLVPPVAGAGPDRVLTCVAPVATLDGSASGGDGSAGYDYLWSPAENVSDPIAEDPTTSVPGTYVVTVTDRATGCTATDSVEVAPDPDAPVASAGPDRDITCGVVEVVLDGDATGGDASAGYGFAWEPAAAVSDPTAKDPTTTTPGTYVLTITTLADGCTAQDVVVVHDLTAAPAVTAGPDRALTCVDTQVTLEGAASGSDGRDGWSYEWSPPDQVSDPSAAQPVTSQPGTYRLVARDAYTGCSATDEVVVTLDVAAPTADAGPDRHLDCTTAQVTLAGGGSSASGSHAFQWEPAAQVSDPAAAQPTVSAPGTYVLKVTDTVNGCTATDEVVVTQDVAAPVAGAGPDRTLTCAVEQVMLDGSASGGSGGPFAFAWEPAGQVSDPSAAQPTTSVPGTYVVTVTDLGNGCTAADAVVVDADTDPAIDVTAGPDRAITCATPVVTLLADAAGAANLAYAWEPASQVSDPSVLRPTTSEPGTYVLTVTNPANGCSVQDAVVVSQVGPPVLAAQVPAGLDCDTTSVALVVAVSGGDPSGGRTWSWEPASDVTPPDAASPSTALPGTYTVTVTDAATGCSSSAQVTVVQDVAPPVVSAGPDRILGCANGVVELLGEVLGGSGAYAHAWEPDQHVSDPSVLRPTTARNGTYTLTVTDLANGCTASDTVEVTRDMRPPRADAGPDKVLTCATTSVAFDASASGGNGSEGYAFSWSPSAPPVSVPGTYVLTVTDVANGCTDTDTVVVTQDVAAPVASAGPDKSIDCRTSEVTLEGGASGGNGSLGHAYAWAPAADVSDPAAAQPTTRRPGTYVVTVTDLANGCTGTDTVVVADGRRAPVADAGPDAVLPCTQASTTLTGSASGAGGSYDFAWSPAGAVTQPDAAITEALAAGTFTLTVTDRASGCTDTDTVVVTSPDPPPVVSAGPDVTLGCAGPAPLRGTASGGGPFEVAWTPAGGVADPASLTTTTSEPGTYTLTVRDTRTGCRASDEVVVVEGRDLPIVSAGPDLGITCSEPTVQLLGTASGTSASPDLIVSWTPAGGLSDPGALQPIASLPGTYRLTVTDRSNGCTATDDVVVTRRDQLDVLPIAGPTLTCEQPTAALDPQIVGSSGDVACAWTPPAGLADAASCATTALQAGSWTLTVTDRVTGCVDRIDVVVAEDLRTPTADAGPDVTIDCASPQVALAGTASGGNGSLGYDLTWSPSGPVVSAPGTYTLTVRDRANGCTATDTVEVVAVAAPAPREPSAVDLAPAAEPLRVTWGDPLARTVLRMTWEDTGAFGYRVFAGTIANLRPRRTASYDHAPAACDVPSASTSLPRPAGNAYFLVASANCDGLESAYGRDSFAAAHPDSTAASGTSCP